MESEAAKDIFSRATAFLQSDEEQRANMRDKFPGEFWAWVRAHVKFDAGAGRVDKNTVTDLYNMQSFIAACAKTFGTGTGAIIECIRCELGAKTPIHEPGVGTLTMSFTHSTLHVRACLDAPPGAPSPKRARTEDGAADDTE